MRVETGEGWSRGFGKWIRARQQVRNELQHGEHLHYVLQELGFTAASDQADTGRRRSYVCSTAATPLTMADLTSFLADYGWKRDEDRPSGFVNRHTGAILDVETGGSTIAVTHDEAASS